MLGGISLCLCSTSSTSSQRKFSNSEKYEHFCDARWSVESSLNGCTLYMCIFFLAFFLSGVNIILILNILIVFIFSLIVCNLQSIVKEVGLEISDITKEEIEEVANFNQNVNYTF